ncbi:MAG: dTDP-4-dehydrorhamnose 3,5-epimerase [Candidatus Margulisiibacteriota bacterium]|nr:dTDP-4-dehydrorhamnose 3,5-epimerase [Candidatus Margulisiibacteriota bacterium]
MNFKFEETSVKGVLRITPKVFADDRGFFMESYSKRGFAEAGFKEEFVQDNHSRSKKGVVRGLHYQLNPSPMGKLLKVVRGKVFDVGVDVRKGSPTFGKWYGEILSGENHTMLYFPPGIAHGFLCLEDGTEAAYKCTGLYDQKAERALLWNDPEIAIAWPLDQVGEVIVSEKDKIAPKLKYADAF